MLGANIQYLVGAVSVSKIGLQDKILYILQISGILQVDGTGVFIRAASLRVLVTLPLEVGLTIRKSTAMIQAHMYHVLQGLYVRQKDALDLDTVVIVMNSRVPILVIQ
jgi:hypothetical protein